MKLKTTGLSLPVIALVGGLSLSATALQYDASVSLNGPAPSNGNDQGIYYGSGNGNGGWTVDTQSNVELGLRAHVRWPTPANIFNSTGDGEYWFTDSSLIPPPNNSSWNVDFAINTRADGTGNQTFSGYSFKLLVDIDPGLGQNFINVSLNSSVLWLLTPPLGNNYIAQDSQNFQTWVPGYNPDIAGSYDFILKAFQGQNQVAITQIRVNVNGGAYPNPNVPDAASTGVLALLGLIPVLGVAHTLRRRPVAN